MPQSARSARTANEPAVRDLVGPGSQVVHAGFNGNGHTERVAQVDDRAAIELDAPVGLPRQKKTGEEVRRQVEAEMFAGPGCAQALDRFAQERQLRAVRLHAPPDRRANAVHQLAAGKRGDVRRDISGTR